MFSLLHYVKWLPSDNFLSVLLGSLPGMVDITVQVLYSAENVLTGCQY